MGATTPHRHARFQILPLVLALGMLLPLPGCSSRRPPDLDLVIQRTVVYLRAQYNPEVGLLRESPETAPTTHWIYTDNWLAGYALTEAGDSEFAAALNTKIDQYMEPHGHLHHGLIEVLGGERVGWPPRTHRVIDLLSAPSSPPCVRAEIRDGVEMLDWEQYADLAFIGALDALHEGNANLGMQRFRAGMATWTGVGFADAAFGAGGSRELYATYKLALAVRTAGELRVPLNPEILEHLLDKQVDNGGFVTLYDIDGVPQGDTNTETSAYALLALLAWSHR